MIGRKRETETLRRLYDSKKAQLVAVYGRRRVGKTFLVDETFRGEITFRHAGLSPVEGRSGRRSSPLKKQLKHFYNSLLIQGMEKSRCPESWLDAFFMLELFLQERDDGGRQLVFLDELPWMDTPRSGFVTAFEAFWNSWGCHRPNLMVIVCGSATSWVIDELVDNHGGLYNRVTCEIKLSPFTLGECEEFFAAEGIRMSRYDIVQSYMIFGGIPYYLSYFQRGQSLPQNVDGMLFSSGAALRDEYDRLFSSVFSNPEMMKSIVGLLSTRSAGYTRVEITKKTPLSGGGTLTDALKALEASDFIVRYVPFGEGKRSEHYKLVDPFCMFYLRFVEGKSALDGSFWQQSQAAQSVVAWRGFAFENVCFSHLGRIKDALGIGGIGTRQSAWSKSSDEGRGAQIDLVIERRDNVVNLCEMKFYGNDFAVDKDYYRIMLNKRDLLERELSPKTAVHTTLVTTFGLKYNEYSGVFDNVVVMDSLFKD